MSKRVDQLVRASLRQRKLGPQEIERILRDVAEERATWIAVLAGDRGQMEPAYVGDAKVEYFTTWLGRLQEQILIARREAKTGSLRLRNALVAAEDAADNLARMGYRPKAQGVARHIQLGAVVVNRLQGSGLPKGAAIEIAWMIWRESKRRSADAEKYEKEIRSWTKSIKEQLERNATACKMAIIQAKTRKAIIDAEVPT